MRKALEIDGLMKIASICQSFRAAMRQVDSPGWRETVCNMAVCAEEFVTPLLRPSAVVFIPAKSNIVSDTITSTIWLSVKLSHRTAGY